MIKCRVEFSQELGGIFRIRARIACMESDLIQGRAIFYNGKVNIYPYELPDLPGGKTVTTVTMDCRSLQSSFDTVADAQRWSADVKLCIEKQHCAYVKTLDERGWPLGLEQGYQVFVVE